MAPRSHRSASVWRWVLLVLAGAVAVAAAPRSVQAASPAARTGVLRGIVFEKGTDRALPGVTVWVVPAGEPGAGGAKPSGGRTTRTTSDGGFRLELAPGEYDVRFRARAPEATVSLVKGVPTRRGFATELLVTVDPEGGPPRVDLEAPVDGAQAEGGTGGGDTPAVEAGPPGELVGTVVANNGGRAISGARLYVRGQTVEARSDGRGRFRLALPAGTHDVTALATGYSPETVRAVVVPAGGEGTVRLELRSAAVTLDEYVVLAPELAGSTFDLMDERREAAVVMDVLGAEEMAKRGDSDAASALKRVTGVTVVGGKYVFVRGLGKRYSSTLLNGLGLPSPEPTLRTVPLDLFPVGLLDAMVVQKVWTPNLPGEFGGGMVLLRTKAYPRETEGSVSASLGYRQDTTFERGLRGSAGPLDWLGIDAGFREMPGLVADAADEGLLLEGGGIGQAGFSPSEMQAIGRALPNRWRIGRETVRPNLGAGFTYGMGGEALGGRGGFMLAFDWGSSFTRRESELTIFKAGQGGEAEFMHGYDYEDLVQDVQLSAFATTGLKLDHHELALNAMVLRITSDDARWYEGFNGDLGADIRVRRLQWVERMLTSVQLIGSHDLPDVPGLSLEWGYAFSHASRFEPDRLETRVDQEEDTDIWRYSDRPEGAQRVFGDLEDIVNDVHVDGTYRFELPWVVAGGAGGEGEAAAPTARAEGLLRFGLAGYLKLRESVVRRYRMFDKGPLAKDPVITALEPHEMFARQYIGPDAFQMTETTLASDSYDATQWIAAAYVMAEVPLPFGLQLVGGLRLEHSSQLLETFKPHSPTLESETAELATTDVLPNVALNAALPADVTLRLSWARTLNRPGFREMSPSIYNEITGGRAVVGNTDLGRAIIDHVDLRAEWYPTQGVNLSVAGFAKFFQDPIETIVIPAAQQMKSFDNTDSALNYGLELDVSTDFGFVADALSDLSLGVNAAWIQSSVTIPEDAINTSKERPLEGQSPFVVNVSLTYDNADLGTSVTALYNVFGRRIASVGAQGLPDIYEEPVHQLDVVYRQALPHGFALSLKMQNLLDLPIELTQSGLATEVYRRGRVFSLGVSKGF